MERPHLLDMYLLTVCSNGELSLWTINGAHIGVFGQGVAWALTDFGTYRDPKPAPLYNVSVRIHTPPLSSLSAYERQLRIGTTQMMRSLRASSVSGLDASQINAATNDAAVKAGAQTDQHVEYSPPRRGEVWVRRNKQGGVQEVLTVNQVEFSRGRCTGWEGTHVKEWNISLSDTTAAFAKGARRPTACLPR